MALSSCQLVVIDIWLKPLVSGWMNRSQVKGRSIGDAIDCFILRFYLINGNDAVDFVSFFSISIFIHIWNVGQGRTFCIRIIQHWKLLNRLPHQGRRKCIDYSWFIDENNSKFYKSKQWTLLSQQSRLHLRIAVFSNFFYRYLLMTAIFIERQRWIYSNGCAKLREQPPPSCFQQKSKLNLFNILLLNNELC